MDLTDVMAQLKPHVNVLDYPVTKPALLQLLAKHIQVIALPGEPLGVTKKLVLYLSMSLLIGCYIANGKWFSRRSTNFYKKELFKNPSLLEIFCSF